MLKSEVKILKVHWKSFKRISRIKKWLDLEDDSIGFFSGPTVIGWKTCHNANTYYHIKRREYC